MKNTLTIAITKYYTFKTYAETMDIAFDEYINTTPVRRRYKGIIIEPIDFKINEPKKRKTKEKK